MTAESASRTEPEADADFRVLGPLGVTVGGREISVDSGKQRVLLVALLLHRGETVETERLAEWLWDDRQPANPRAALHTYVRRLRVLLGTPGLVVTAPHGYRLEAPADAVDLCRMRRLVQDSRAAASPAEQDRALDEARALWRGTPLVDVSSDALRRDLLPSLEDEHLGLLESHFETGLALGRHIQLVKDLRSTVMEHPLRENFWCLLMLALYRSGRQAEALAAYRQARRELVEQLGVDPGERLRTLHTGILESDPQLSAPSNSSGEGIHLLTAPAQLPPLPMGYVNRSEGDTQLEQLLPPDPKCPGVPVVVLCGPPGVGKTSLAVRLGRTVRDRFPDGQLYVNLRGHEEGDDSTPLSPPQVLAQFLRSLGVPPAQIPVDLTEQVNLYRSRVSGKRILVVLDNAAHERQVAPLIPGEAGCSVLITSRRKLRGLTVTHGAHVVQVEALSPQDAAELVGGMLRQARIATDPAVISEIAELCAYLPLALRIAAANVIAAPGGRIDDYLDRLRQGNRLAALAVGDDTTSAVSAAIALSYDAMATSERTVFRLAGIFPGTDFSPEAIAALTDMSEAHTRAALNRLESANLLQQHVPGRFHFHDLLRTFAQERAHAEQTKDERAASLERLGRWYLAGAGASADILYPEFVRLPPPRELAPLDEIPHFTDKSQATAWLLAERRNLVTAIELFGHQGPHHFTWYLADALRGFFWTGKFRTDWDEVSRIGLDAAMACEDTHGIASMHRSRANLHNTVGQFQRALVHQERSLTLHNRLGMPEEAAATLNNMSLAHLSLGQVHAATGAALQALNIARRIGSLRLEASSLGLFGTIRWTMGDLVGATTAITESLALADELGMHHFRSYGLRNLGLVRQAAGELHAARSSFVAALEVSEAIDSSYDRSISLYGIALVDQQLGDPQRASSAALRALAAFKECGDRTFEIETLCVLSAVNIDTGDFLDAIRYAQTALEASVHIGYADGEAHALTRLAVAESSRGKFLAAARNAEKAWERIGEKANRTTRGRVLTALGPLYRTLGDEQRAEQCARWARELSPPPGSALRHHPRHGRLPDHGRVEAARIIPVAPQRRL